MKDLLANPLVLRAAVVGLFGGVGLSLTSIYSRRGPLIYPVYAALLPSLALLLARQSQSSFALRTTAAFVGFTVATLMSYITVGVLASRHREVFVAQGRLAPNSGGVSPLGHVWRWALLSGIGIIASAAIAFVSG
ncbi:MAG TPA: hypothetical protein VLN49_16480 [Gemmatimonadaceae bacterium]|nr:hypothetical protein [Gemmatimonadaceae bacterium]